MILISVCPSSPGWNELRFRYAPAVIAELKQIPGVQWVPEKKVWRAPDNVINVLASVLGTKARLVPGPVLYQMTQPPTPFLVENLRPYQQQGVQTLIAKRDFILAFDMRLGKGGRPSDLVLTPKGWTTYGKIRVGDEVIGSSGYACRVTGVFPRGKRRFMRVSFSDGASISVSEDHLWAVRSATMKQRGEGWKVFETSALARDSLLDAAGNARWFIPVVKPVQFTPVFSTLSVHPYVLGVLLGDGHFGATTSFCPGDEAVPREVEKLLPPSVKMKTWRAKDRAPVYSLVGFGPFARDLGLVGTRAWNKRIPLPYLYASIEERRELLRGLLDTDGYITDSIIEYTTASEGLADDVTFLVRSLGGLVRRKLRAAPSYSYKGEKRTGRPSHRLHLTLPTDFVPTRVGAGDYTPRVREPVRAIRSIEADGEDDCICIAVDAADSLYVAEHFIVTHNTRSASAAAASLLAHGVVNTIAIFYPASVKEEWTRQFKDQTGLEVLPFEGLKNFDPMEFTRLARLQHLCVGMHYELIRDRGDPMGGRASEFLSLLEQRGPFIVIADEVQWLKNRKAGRTKFAHEVSRSKFCWGRWSLTGTPMRNYPRDMWAMFEFTQPGSMGSYSKFTTRYADGHMGTYGWEDSGVTHADELRDRLAATMFRLTRADVAQWLPKSERSVVLCDMNAADLKRYQKAERVLGGEAVKAMNEGSSQQALASLRELSRMTTASKTATLLERIYEHVEVRGVKAIVFANFHETLEQAIDAWEADTPAGRTARVKPGGIANAHNARFKRPGFVAGGWLTPERRRKAIDQWKATPGSAVLFANTLSSGVGIDLSDADVSLFVELSWVPADFLQAEARTQDVHQGKRKVPAINEYLLTRKTIDETMGLRLIKKVQGIEKVVGASADTSALVNTLSNSGLVERSQIALASEDPETVGAVLADLRARLFGDETPDDAGEDTDNVTEEAADDEAEEEAEADGEGE